MILAAGGRRISVPRRDLSAIVVLLRAETELASWPLTVPDRHDLGVVDELARLQLAARRLGCSIRLRDVCSELSELLNLLGLAEAIGADVGPPPVT